MNFKALLGTVKKGLVKHAPEILVGVGITSFVVGTVTAIKATPKAVELIKEAEKEKGEELTKPEVVKTVWKQYIPTAISVVTGAACVIGAHKAHVRKTATIATACQLAERSLEEFKTAAIETVGEKKMKVIHEKMAEKAVENMDEEYVNANTTRTKYGDVLFYDGLTGRYFRSDMQAIRAAVNDVNEVLLDQDYVELNDLYYRWGLETVDIGEELGWNHIMGDKVDIVPTSKITKWGEPCIVITHNVTPKYDFSSFS